MSTYFPIPHIFLQRLNGISGHKKQDSLPESSVLQVMNVAIPTAPPTTVTSSLHHFKRKLQSGKTETYDLAKVTDIILRMIHTSLFKTPELINSIIFYFE